MKKLLLVVLALSFCSGCSWLVPGAVKREVALMRTDLSTALVEVKALQGDEAKAKALSTLNRLDKGLTVVDDYANGRRATR